MKGILFRNWKIKAILADPGREWQTRRVMKPQPNSDVVGFTKHGDEYLAEILYNNLETGEIEKYICGDIQKRIKPRYQVGEVVYTKEACFIGGVPPHEWVTFKGEKGIDDSRMVWRSPLFMPAWAARYFVKILDVTPQRLQEISETDILAEGCPQIVASCGLEVQWFKDIWDSDNPKFPWAMNLWVFKYVVKLVEKQ